MKNTSGIAQLFLRLALGIGFLMPVMDRLGFMGPQGSGGATWGDWKHFIDYTNTLIPFASRPVSNIMGFLATIAEAVFGICLIIGFRIKEVALGAGILTLVFGLCMAIFLSIGAPFNYPVFVFTGSALVLSDIDHYKWSIDNYIKKKIL
ncbi:DoxX family protein [Mucilaginibacter sabulilitoris]|uniref:DoxX family protein n=1 Tax=Mucilaginibacter sabulilitoris TaxID=1173583 RepID=A0ABZ0TK10_9SPHI|nr:DoxX family protein [Mucilaginibacter sabulilitoris]WPU93159.1 DoxX family protein [Mucilaginibacter sabulilitoris]